MEEPYEEERLELFKNGVYSDVKDILGEVTQEEFFAAFLKRRFDYTEAIDGMLELIKDLKAAGHKIGIITDGISEVQHRKAQTLGLDTLVDHVFASGDFGYGKPDTKFFFGAMKAAGVRAENCIMIGNNINSDVFGALASGMKAIYFGQKPKNYKVLYAPDAKALREVLREELR
jgi:HAD superfamily hydrolase (TIGR01549 family)